MSDKNNLSDNTAATPGSVTAKAPWSWYKKLGFRIIFVFFLAMSIPFSASWYSNVFTLDWLHPHYRDIYDIARFQPSFRSFFGGRGGGDNIADAPADNNKEPGVEQVKKGSRRHHATDSTETQNGEKHGSGKRRHHHDGGNQIADNGDGFKKHHREGNNNAESEGRHHRRHPDSTQTGGSGQRMVGEGFRRHRGDSSLVNNGEGPRRHRRGGDSTEVSNVNNGEGHRRHRRGGDSTQVANVSEHGSNNIGGFGKHRRHRDSTLTANNTGGGRRHRDSLTNGADSSEKHTARAAFNGNRRGRDGNDALPPKRGFFEDYTDWGIAFLIGIAGGLIWTLLDWKSKSYNLLYYWIRVVVRYRAGIGIIGFGFTKLFPTQMPYPSLGLLNSNFGDYTAQKIYWLSVGVVPWYQVFGGIVEIAAGTMLFFRRTTTFGALLLVGALGDITYVNYAYDGGVHVYAFYFVFLGLFMLADDIPKLYNLLILEKYTVPFRIYPDFRKPWLKYTRMGLKALTFIIFFGVLTYTEVINFKYDPYKQPSTAGVKQLRGNYHVTEFKVNGQEISYNPLDTLRWQEATFENWTTLTFKVNHPVLVDPSNGGGSPMKDIQRTFEISGVAGGQRAFHYYADTVDKVLYLQDKNVMGSRGSGRGGRGGINRQNAGKPKEDNWISKTAWQHIGDEKNFIDKRAWSTRRDREFAAKARETKRNRMVLNYQTTDGSKVVLTGINERKDSIYVVLDRYERQYVLPASTLSAGKY